MNFQGETKKGSCLISVTLTPGCTNLPNVWEPTEKSLDARRVICSKFHKGTHKYQAPRYKIYSPGRHVLHLCSNSMRLQRLKKTKNNVGIDELQSKTEPVTSIIRSKCAAISTAVFGVNLKWEPILHIAIGNKLNWVCVSCAH